MKLTSIDATVVHATNQSVEGIPLIEIRADNELTGWGEARASRSPEAVCDIVRALLSPLLIDLEFRGERREIESIWDSLYAPMRNQGQTGGFMLEAIAAVDMALWDLAGRARQQAVHQLAGGPAGNLEVESFTSLSCGDAAALAGSIETMRSAGLGVFELVHDHSEEALIAALDAANAAMHGAGCMAVNGRWRLSAGWDLTMERQIDRRAPLWLANPLPPEDPFAHGRLSKVLCAPIALGESYHTHYELAPFFHELALGMLQPDLGRCGLTEAFRMAEMAKNQNIPVAVRVGESLGPQLAAALQFAASAPGRRVEYRPDGLRTANCALARPIELKQGKYQVSNTPGLGIEIEEAEIHLMEIQVA